MKLDVNTLSLGRVAHTVDRTEQGTDGTGAASAASFSVGNGGIQP